MVLPSPPSGLERPMLVTASSRLLMLGQRMSSLQLGWQLLSLLTVEERLARLVEGGSSVSRDVLGLGFVNWVMLRHTESLSPPDNSHTCKVTWWWIIHPDLTRWEYPGQAF